MELPIVAVILLAVAVGSSLQRLSGVGTGLVVAPTLSIVLGPVLGVTVTNLTTLFSAIIIGIALWRDADVERLTWLLPAAVPGAVLGAIVVRETPTGWLNMLVGAAVCLGLTTTMILERLHGLPHLTSVKHAAWAGFLGGFLNITSAVAMPALVIYSVLSRWEQRSFRATTQVVFLVLAILSVGLKLALGATTFDEMPQWWVMALIVLTIVIAVRLVGHFAHKVSPSTARTVAIALAGLGGLVTLVRGVTEVLGG